MSHRKLTLLAILIFICLTSALPAMAVEAEFLTVIDGDSLIVAYGGHSHRIRLIGIDCPEKGQEYSARAKTHALTFCYNKHLRLEFDKRKKDRYGRELAYVYCGDKMLNAELIREGLALAIKVKPNTQHYEQFKQLEAAAKEQKKGFWRYGGLEMTPAEWRQSHRKK